MKACLSGRVFATAAEKMRVAAAVVGGAVTGSAGSA